MKSKFTVKPIFTAIIILSILFIALNAIDIVKNVMSGGDALGYYSSLDDYRNAYPLITSFDDKYLYKDSIVIATVNNIDHYCDFVIKNGKVSIVKIDYKNSSSGEKFKLGSSIKHFPFDEWVVDYDKRYNEGCRTVETLFDSRNFEKSQKNQLWICILSAEYSLEISDVDKYGFSYNNEQYILYVKHIVAE